MQQIKRKNFMRINLVKISLSISVLFFISGIVRAESLECKGSVPPENTTSFQINLNVDHPGTKNTIEYFLPDGSSHLQALGIDKRKYQGSKVVYVDSFNPSVNIAVEMQNNKILKATYTNVKAGYDALALTCDLFGQIPERIPCADDKDLALVDALKNSNDLEVIGRAIECGANVNLADEKGCTPLMFALDASCGADGVPKHGPGGGEFAKTKDIVDLLINNGAYVNVADKSGETALIKAVRNNVQDVYESFIASEVEIDAKDRLGNTALMYAATEGNVSIVKDLLLANPDRRILNSDGMSAYDLAVHWQRSGVIELLKIPDLTIAINGQADGTCSPLSIKVGLGQTVELILKGSSQMFRLESKKLSLDMMAAPGQMSHQIFVTSTKGQFEFTCGFHGGTNPSKGIIQVQ